MELCANKRDEDARTYELLRLLKTPRSQISKSERNQFGRLSWE